MNIVIPATSLKGTTIEPKFFGYDINSGVDALLVYLFSACPSIVSSEFINRVVTDEVLDMLGVNSPIKRAMARDIIRESLFNEARKVRENG